MYLRLTLALVVAVVLAATHWKAYVAGQGSVQAQWDLEKYDRMELVVKAERAAREREQALRKTVENQDHELQKQKALNAALSRAHAERLREYEAALSRAAEDPAPTGGTAGPFARIAGECGAALTALDEHARGLATTARALQDYAAGVCVTVPAGR